MVAPDAERMVENVIPILSVLNLQRSFDFYVTALGFKKDWSTQGVGSVSRDGCAIMLAETPNGVSRSAVWIGVENVVSMFNSCQASGAKILLEPTNFDWACEMRVEDPDGHVMRIGGEPLTE